MILFPKQFTVRGSQCFKEWSPWCWMVWSGSRPACFPLPFICLSVLFICLRVLFICFPGWVLVVGFPAGLFPTSFHLSPTLLFTCLPGWAPTSFHLSPTSFNLSPRLGACGRVPGWLVSHFLSFVSQARCLCLPLPFICLPLLFRLGASGPVPGWLVFHFLSFVSHFFSFVSHFFSFVSQAGCL